MRLVLAASKLPGLQSDSSDQAHQKSQKMAPCHGDGSFGFWALGRHAPEDPSATADAHRDEPLSRRRCGQCWRNIVSPIPWTQAGSLCVCRDVCGNDHAVRFRERTTGSLRSNRRPSGSEIPGYRFGLADGRQEISVDHSCTRSPRRATPSSRAACDSAKKHTCEELVQDNILWRIDDPDNSASKHWQQKNLDDLCACTTDPYATVNCFQIQVNNNRKSWQEAIATCRAKP